MHQHSFLPSKKEGYEICLECGSYHSTRPGNIKAIYEGNYWDGKERSTFEDQRHNIIESESCGISKRDKILQYVPYNVKTVLEIGCSPGELLKSLSEGGYEVYGIEPDGKLIHKNLEVAPRAHIINGYFPDVFKGADGSQFDYIIGMDVLEHSIYYHNFIMETHRLLKPGGSAIFMLPIITEDHGDIREKDYKCDEHIWLFTQSYLQGYLSEIFATVKFDFWQEGHNMIICTK